MKPAPHADLKSASPPSRSLSRSPPVRYAGFPSTRPVTASDIQLALFPHLERHHPRDRIQRRQNRLISTRGSTYIDLVCYVIYLFVPALCMVGHLLWTRLASDGAVSPVRIVAWTTGWSTTALYCILLLVPIQHVYSQAYTWIYQESIGPCLTRFVRLILHRDSYVLVMVVVVSLVTLHAWEAEFLLSQLWPTPMAWIWTSLVGDLVLLGAMVCILSGLLVRPLAVYQFFISRRPNVQAASSIEQTVSIPPTARSPTTTVAVPVTPTATLAVTPTPLIRSASQPVLVTPSSSSTCTRQPASAKSQRTTPTGRRLQTRRSTLLISNRRPPVLSSQLHGRKWSWNAFGIGMGWTLYLIGVRLWGVYGSSMTILVDWLVYASLVALILLTTRYTLANDPPSARFYNPWYLVLFVWINYVFVTVIGVVMNTVYRDLSVSQLSDSHTSTSTTTAALYKSWSNPNTSIWMYIGYLVINELLFVMWRTLLERATAPFLYLRFLYPYQLWSVICPFTIFGFTPVSYQLLALFLIGALHQLMWVTDGYERYVMHGLRYLSRCGRPLPATPTSAVAARAHHDLTQQVDIVHSVLSRMVETQLYFQETVAKVQVFVGFVAMLQILRFLDIRTDFTDRFVLGADLWLVVFLQLLFQFGLWAMSYRVFRLRIESSLNSYRLWMDRRRWQDTHSSLAHMLDRWIQVKLNVSVDTYLFQITKQGFELDHPELYAEQANSRPLAASRHLLQWHQWFPTPLRKNLVYFSASACLIYLNMFMVNPSCIVRYFGVVSNVLEPRPVC